jgi:Family of unknown function (DUF695)
MFGLFTKSRGAGPPPADSWSIAQGKNDGRPMFVRINDGLHPIVGKPPFDQRFGVAVPLRAPDPNGFPVADESEALNKIEDELLNTFQSSRQTLLALVITTSGFREFVFYTSVAEQIGPAMEQVRARTASHELQFYIQPDKSWEVYRAFRS